MKSLLSIFKNKQFLTFLIVGLLSTALDFMIMSIMLNFLGFSPALSSVTGFLISLIFNFICSEKFVFKVKSTTDIKVWFKFALTSILGLLITGYGINFFSTLGINVWIVKCFLTAVIMAINFVLRKFFVFKKQEIERP